MPLLQFIGSVCRVSSASARVLVCMYIYICMFFDSRHILGGYKIVLPMLGVIIAIPDSAGLPPRIVLEIVFS